MVTRRGEIKEKWGQRREIHSQKSLERLALTPSQPHSLCGDSLCPHLDPALASSNCHCPDIYLPAFALAQGHTGQGKEGGRKGERGKKKGGGISAAKKTKR